MKANLKPIWLPILLFAALVIAALAIPGGAAAQTIPEEMRTLYVSGNINAGFNFPLRVYIIDDDELILAETWSSRVRGIGPVGVTVDEVNEHLFVSFESSDTVDAFNARDMTPLGRITLSGTGNLAGMTVHEDTGILYVVNRLATTIYEFDSATFAPLGSWEASCGIYDITLTGDVLFASCNALGIRAYDLDTHSELGSYDVLAEAVGLDTTDYPSNIAMATGHFSHDYLVKYEIDPDLMTYIFLGDSGQGVALNPATTLAYATVSGSGFSSPPAIKVIDYDTMTEVRSYPLNGNWSPTGVVASTIPFGGTVQKTSTSHPNGEIPFADTVVFEITIENRHVNAIDVLPLTDTFDETQLTYVSANPAPDTVNPGELIWDDLTVSFGQDLEPSESFLVTVTFNALPQECDPVANGTNLAQMIDAVDDEQVGLNDAAGRFDYTIDCHCQSNADCDDGNYCNGEEICNANQECKPAVEAPCNDDGVYCNGDEECDEDTDSCYSSGDPCADGDGIFCNGSETCNELNQSCDSAGNPCQNDDIWCNGSEGCDETNDQCMHSGNPCPPNQTCDEDEDGCNEIESTPPPEDPDPVEENLLESVTGGACG
jgi:hypothetical protein